MAAAASRQFDEPLPTQDTSNRYGVTQAEVVERRFIPIEVLHRIGFRITG